ADRRPGGAADVRGAGAVGGVTHAQLPAAVAAPAGDGVVRLAAAGEVLPGRHRNPVLADVHGAVGVGGVPLGELAVVVASPAVHPALGGPDRAGEILADRDRDPGGAADLRR